MASRRGNGSDLEDILRMNSADLSDAIETDVTRVVDRLHSDGIIDIRTQRDINSLEGVSSYDKASRLVTKLTSSLIAHGNQHQFLLDLCNSLLRVKNDSVISIASRIMQAIGHDVDKSTPGIATSSNMSRSREYLDETDMNEIIDTLEEFHFTKSDWITLGLKLGLYYPTLQDIDQQNRGKLDDCLREALKLWLNKGENVMNMGGPKWTSLAAAIRKTGNNALAMRIEHKYKLF
jgi:hypothetical protein